MSVRAKAPAEVRDGLGQPVTGHLRDVFLERRHFLEARQKLTHVKRITTAILEGPACKLLAAQNAFEADRRSLRSRLEWCCPFAACPYCDGRQRNCKACEGSGWVNRDLYEQAPKIKDLAAAGKLPGGLTSDDD